MKSIIPYIIILVITLWNDTGYAQTRNTSLDKFFTKKMEKAHIVGMQAAFLKDGELQWMGSYGLKNYKTNERVNDSTLFMIASTSKPVTALALLKLYDQNLIGLDNDINDYLPFKISNPNFPDEVITIRMLLSHTTSLKDDWDILDPLYTLDEGGDSPISLGDFIQDYFLPKGKYYNREKNFFNEKPGKYWEYCNMGYVIVGYIIEQVSGKTFSKYMKDEIFTPLHMNNSFWFLKDIHHKNIARPHKLPEKKSVHSEPQVLKHYGYPDFPDGQLRTTVSDYAQILKLILNKGSVDGFQFLKKETVDKFLNIQFPNVNKWQAIAWNYNEFENWLYYLFMPHLPSHTGGDPGVATVTSFNPETRTGAIVFINSPPTTFKGGKILYLDMVRKLLNEAKRE